MVLSIFKMTAISGFVTALDRTKFVFGRDSAPVPAGGTYSASPDPLAGLRGPTSKGEERDKEKGKGKKGRENGRERERSPLRKFLDPPLRECSLLCCVLSAKYTSNCLRQFRRSVDSLNVLITAVST